MSQDIRIYETAESNANIRLKTSAYFGGDEDGHAIQLTIGREYVQLTETQILDLIGVLARRVKSGDQTMSATGQTDTKTVKPNGTLEVQGEEIL